MKKSESELDELSVKIIERIAILNLKLKSLKIVMIANKTSILAMSIVSKFENEDGS